MRFFVAILILYLLCPTLWAQSATPPSTFASLHKNLSSHMADPAFNTRYGMAALDEGLTTEAIAAFERVLAVQPANLPVRTELARAYALLGDTATAAAELETVANQPQTPPEVRTNLRTTTNLLQQSLRGGPRTYAANFEAAFGTDSNINTATNSSYVVLPSLAALGPAKLDDAATSKSSLFTETSANLTVRQPLSPAWAVYGGAGVSHKHAFTSTTFNQSSLGAEAGIQHLAPAGRRLTLGASVRQFWYGGDNYSQTVALTGNGYQPLGVHTNLAFSASAAHTNYPTLPEQDADRLTLGTTLDTRSGRAYAFTSLYGGTEDAAASLNSHTFLGTMLGAEYLLSTRLATNAEARYEVRDYNGENPTFLTARLDRQLDLSVGLTYTLTPNLSLRPQLAYRHAHSNLATANYTRWQSLVALRYTLP